MKLSKLVEHETALNVLAGINLSDAQKAWDLSIALDTAKGLLQKYNEKRDELVKKHGEEIKGQPENYNVKDIAAFTKDMKPVLEVDVVIKFPKFSLALLNGVQVSAANMSAWRDLCILTKK